MITALRHSQSVAAGAASPANDNSVIALPNQGTLQHVSSILAVGASGPVHVDINIWDESVTNFTFYGALAAGTLHTNGILASDAVMWTGSLDLSSLISPKLLPNVDNETASAVGVITVAYVERK